MGVGEKKEFRIEPGRRFPDLPQPILQRKISTKKSSEGKFVRNRPIAPPPSAKVAPVLARGQRVKTKSRPTQSAGQRWGRYGKDYLTKEGKGKDGGRGEGFNQEGPVDLGETLKAWQKAGDDHFHNVMIIPSRWKEIDLETFTKNLMQQVERDMGQPLEWGAVIHHDTEQLHVHLVLRGDTDHEWHFNFTQYSYARMGHHASEIATRTVGANLDIDILKNRETGLTRHAYTGTDKDLWDRRDENYRIRVDEQGGTAVDRAKARQELQRLAWLENQGLATKTGEKEWELYHTQAVTFNKELHYRSANIENAPDYWKQQDPRQDHPLERAQEERQRLTRAIDEQEHGR